jgi:hypothetical protein
LKKKADQIKTLALTETSQLEEKPKSHSPIQQNNNKQGVAWKVETRASLCCQQEQTKQEAASLEQEINKTLLEISHLEQEAKSLKEKLHSVRPKTPLMDEEKQEIIKSLI